MLEQVDGTVTGRDTVHALKTDPDFFQAVWNGTKTFEYRRNDRDFKVGDTLVLKETKYSSVEMKMEGKPLEYTGRDILAKVPYIYHIGDAYCILSLNVICVSKV
jgi:hypothetical protein